MVITNSGSNHGTRQELGKVKSEVRTRGEQSDWNGDGGRGTRYRYYSEYDRSWSYRTRGICDGCQSGEMGRIERTARRSL